MRLQMTQTSTITRKKTVWNEDMHILKKKKKIQQAHSSTILFNCRWWQRIWKRSQRVAKQIEDRNAQFGSLQGDEWRRETQLGNCWGNIINNLHLFIHFEENHTIIFHFAFVHRKFLWRKREIPSATDSFMKGAWRMVKIKNQINPDCIQTHWNTKLKISFHFRKSNQAMGYCHRRNHRLGQEWAVSRWKIC